MPTCNTCKRDVAKSKFSKRAGKKKKKGNCMDCEEGKISV